MLPDPDSNTSLGIFSDQLEGDGGEHDDEKIKKHIKAMEDKVKLLRQNADSLGSKIQMES